MHYKKRKLHKLHSIPIGLCNNHHKRLYLVSYSIPLKRMGALLLTGIVCSITFSVLGSFLGLLGSECFAAASATLELGASNLTDEVAQGSTAYASSTIKASGNNDIGSYTLSITGPVQLSNGTTKLNGANGKIGSELEYNTWGYSYNEGNKSNENKTYKSFTGSAQELAKASATTGNKVTIDSTAKDITFAARFADDAATGEYKATVTISLVASPMTVVYRLTYDANGGNTSSVPSVQSETNSNDSHSFNIASAAPTRTGYTFQGWSETSNGAVQYTANGASGTSKTITLQKSSPTKTLYAVWKMDGAQWSNGVGSGITNMQDIKTGFCKNNTNISAGDTIRLKDSRDPNSYTIVKLEDGNCWMQENLQLNLTKSTIVEGSTNNGAAYNWTVPNQDSATTQAYSTSGTWTNDGTVVMSRTGTAENGNYYTWCAATAGTCLSGGGAASICPKGWRLPTGGANGDFTKSDFYDLFGAAGSNLGGDYSTKFNIVRKSPYSFLAAGYIEYNGSLYGVGSLGSYWTSTLADSSNDDTAYTLYFTSTSFEPGTKISSHYRGYSVRCVANY